MIRCHFQSGMPLEYYENMPYKKMMKLQKYYLLEPFGTLYETYRDGVLCSLINNSHVSKREDLRSPHDFFDVLPKPVKEQRSVNNPINILEQMASLGNPDAIKELNKLKGD